MSRSDNNNKNDGNAAVPPDQLDLRRPGSFDQCWKMVAQKITNSAFWIGAELFLSVSAPLGGHQSVQRILAQHIRHLFGVVLPRWEDIVLVPNAGCALQAFSAAFCSAGDVLLCPAPFSDPELPASIASGPTPGVELRAFQLENAAGGLELADLEKAKQDVEGEGRRVRALLLHNPHPLLGGSIRGGNRLLARILEWTSERDLYLLVDESMASFDLWQFSSCLGLDHRGGGQLGQKLVWLWDGAKHLSLPGLEFAAILAPQPERLHPFVRAHPCAPLVQFLTAKLLEDFDWTAELFARRKSRLDELRRSTIEGLAQMGIGEAETAAEASPWILADLKKFLPGEDAQSETALREEFAQSGRLLLASGQQLGMDEFGWFQLRVGQSEEQVEEVLSRLKFVLEGRRRGAAGPVEWERMDVSAKYGGRRIGWEEIDGTIEEKLAMEAIEAGQEEMADEEEEDNVLEPTHREWTMMMPSTSEGAAQMPSLFAYEEEEIRRLSLIREEEGEEDELLRQVFAFEGKKREEERAGRRGTEDEVMREVFAIFPAERLRWKEPLVEEKSAEEEPIGIVETKEGWEEEKMEEKEETRKEEEEVEEVVRIEEYDYVEVKKTVPEDVRNGLDAEREKEQKREEEAQEEYQPKWPTTLTDFSFIEELVRSSEHESAVTTRAAGRMGGEIKLDESGEFYDEASTEEEEGKEEEAGREWRREGKAAEHLTAPLTIDVPILVDKSEQIGEETAHFDESSDSRRIIDIIDQIFHEAVQIRDFSSSSNDSHPNQAVTVHYQQGDHPYWSSTRSDSGLAAESPPDLSFSPLTDTGHQLDSIEERDAEHSTGASPEPTRNEAGQMRLFGGFREGPIQTSTLVREGKRREEGEDEEEEQRSHLGPTAQMLDDSGIFVELPLGSLSIDFPLLVPIGHLRRAQEDGGGIEEGMLRRAKQLDEEEEGGMTVDLRFMTRMEEEEVVEDEGTRGQIRLGKDVAAMEHDHQEMAGKTTVQIRETSERAQIGWEPLENLQEGSLQVGTQRIRVVDSEEAAEEKRREEEEKERLALIAAAMLNEGSAFCPSQSSPIEVVPRGVGGELGGGGEVVPVWEPLGQLKEEGMPKGSEMVREEKGKEEGKKFSETLDELEQIGKAEDKAKEEEKEEEMSRQGVTFATDYKSSVIVGEAEGEEGKMVSRVEVDDGQMRKRSMEPIDVVAEWNAARMAAKKAEMEDEMGKREVARESAEWADAIAEEGGGRRVIEAWEEQRSRAVVEEEVMMKGEEEEEGERLVKTVVKLEAPKKPPRVTMMGAGRRVGKKVEADEEEEAQTGSDHLENIPGRSQAYQVHHRMQMRRREGGRRAQSRDRVILEHMNITEVDYLGGRSERGEHLVTCISTRINRYAPDEFFRRLPVEGMPDLGQQRERMSKMVEVRRRRRTQSGPPAGMEAEGGRSDEIGRTETEMVTIRRLREGEEEEAARARGELHCGLARGGGKGEEEGEGAAEVLVKCQNAEHAERRHHCDPNRLYQLKRTTMMSENGYKKMKREHEERTAPERPPQLHSKFETIHYEMAGDETTKRATTARHRYRRPRRPRSPARIAVTTTRGGAGGGGESIDRVTVRHTPGSSWVVSSVYRTTEYGWERRALTRAGGDWRRSGAEAGAGFG